MDWRTGSKVAFWFLVGVLIYVIIKNWGVEYWWDANTWQIVAAIATWLLAMGVVFAIVQVQQMRRSTNAQLAVELFQQLRDPDLIKILRDIIYKNRREAIKDFIDDDEKKSEVAKIEQVVNRFDMLGALVAKDIIDKEVAIEAFAGPPALRCWYQLTLFMRELQKRRGFYCGNFEDFSRCSLDHFHHEKIEIWLRLDWENDKIALVRELTKLVKEKNELRPRSLEEQKQERKTRG